jgi:hypothetical protein
MLCQAMSNDLVPNVSETEVMIVGAACCVCARRRRATRDKDCDDSPSAPPTTKCSFGCSLWERGRIPWDTEPLYCQNQNYLVYTVQF